MKIAIIRYNAGNVRSVTNALNRFGVEPIVTDSAEILNSCDKVIFPGVGEASTAMKYLRNKGLDEAIRGIRAPFLGICLGLQLMCRHSEENDTTCLDIFPLEVKKFPARDKIPHMGWNNINDLKGPLLQNIALDSHLYFVHSYYAEVSENTVATTNYIEAFSAALQKDNFYAIQSHPEKSGDVGQKILENFLSL
ncbi:MAG: imidazole glycerol phosphate synthase subunit HisH [Bacteroidetes bacterium]|nr:imidazole glycerol phosphate synthase subunit HisH [Bacteroidota bacterium]MDA1120017.1 imidazole glycerol phosphate synthase subunit HisH [Bacteroidota bacterium]